MSHTSFPSSNSKPSLADQKNTEGHGDASASGDFKVSMQAHKICMVIPAGVLMDADFNGRDVPGGILIMGALRANVVCATGSIIVAPGGEFQGNAEANDFFIEGRITSLMIDGEINSFSTIKARGQQDADGKMSGGIIALSEYASVNAHMTAVAYHLPRGANLNSSVFDTLV